MSDSIRPDDATPMSTPSEATDPRARADGSPEDDHAQRCCKAACTTKVESLMTRGVLTMGMDRPISEAKALFDDGKLHHLVVLEHGEVVGVVSDRDVLRWISPFVGKMSERPQDLALLDRPLHQVMSRKVLTVTPETPIERAAALLLERRISCLPVVNEHGHLQGILTWRDMARWLASRAGIALDGAPSAGEPRAA